MTLEVFVGGPLDGTRRDMNDTQLTDGRYEHHEYEKPKYDEVTGEMYDENIVKTYTVYQRNVFRVAAYLPELYVWSPTHLHPADLFKHLVDTYVGGTDDEDTRG